MNNSLAFSISIFVYRSFLYLAPLRYILERYYTLFSSTARLIIIYKNLSISAVTPLINIPSSLYYLTYYYFYFSLPLFRFLD